MPIAENSTEVFFLRSEWEPSRLRGVGAALDRVEREDEVSEGFSSAAFARGPEQAG